MGLTRRSNYVMSHEGRRGGRGAGTFLFGLWTLKGVRPLYVPLTQLVKVLHLHLADSLSTIPGPSLGLAPAANSPTRGEFPTPGFVGPIDGGGLSRRGGGEGGRFIQRMTRPILS